MHHLQQSTNLVDFTHPSATWLALRQTLVGEGLTWDAKTQKLTWVDINGCRLYRLDYHTR
jgi:sugar lactone lactonase YvrE